MWRLYILLLLAWSLTACSGDSAPDEVLPTRVIVATLGSPEVALEVTPVALATLPPSDTLTPMSETTAPLTPGASTETFTPSMTITDTPTRTPSITIPPTLTPAATIEQAAIGYLVELALSVTVPPQYIFGTDSPTIVPHGVSLPTNLFPTPTLPGSNCQYAPAGMFSAVIVSNPLLSNLVGCPVGAPPQTTTRSAAVQTFERGLMIWLSDQPGTIYVLFNNGTLQRYQDTFVSGTDPESGGETPPSGLLEPIRGFGKIWRENPSVRDGLGWATLSESADTATIQEFTNGRMVYLPTRSTIYILAPTGGTWQSTQS